MKGIHYFIMGFSLAMRPGIKRYVLMPLLINALFFGGACYLLFSFMSQWLTQWTQSLPDWLQWLSLLLLPLAALAIIVIFSYFFSTIANIIAAPFNVLLAEKLESQLTGNPAPHTTIGSVLRDIPRTIGREWQKLVYYIPKAIGLMIVLFIPAIGQTLGTALWFMFSTWMLAIQYLDYPFDNNKVPFAIMRRQLATPYSVSFGFGAATLLFTMIPLLNLIVIPVAVCGATALWVDQYKSQTDVM
ncbi:sulfate transporter CysZ [Thaumasiovibrio sp. DFM-14]|uniref:sulfate transporter CysZ n=1 Tax=Thaumasiovibrio sp. DFM-14 TaxID=3384792 RepID=UPI0039A1C7AF